eukprot:g12248.t1
MGATVQQKLDETASQAAAKAKSEEKGKEKLLYFRKDDCEWNLRTEIGKKVTFAVYLDDKGAGAKDVAPVHHGALARDLHAAKDSKGRDPAVSYGDVQLQRHLERFQKLVLVLPERSRCPLGRHCLRVLVSVLYSGLPWNAWFVRYEATVFLCGKGWQLVFDVYGVWGSQSYCRTHAAPLLRHACALARAAASAALTAAGLRSGGNALQLGWAPGLDVGFLAQTQTAVRLVAGRHTGGPKAIFTPPLPQLLLRVEQANQKYHRAWMRQGRDIVYCGSLPIEANLEELCKGIQGECLIHFQLQETDAGHRAPECFEHYRSVGQALQSLRPMASWTTLLVSSGTWTWTEDLAHDLRRLLHERHQAAREVDWAGLATINSSRIFNWPVRRVTHKYWKLAYEEYATGHETSPFLPLAQFWAVGDTTSGTRVYGTKSFVGLMRRLAEREREYEWGFAGAELPSRRSIDPTDFTHLPHRSSPVPARPATGALLVPGDRSSRVFHPQPWGGSELLHQDEP